MKFLALIVLLASTAALAGKEAGGGNAVVCFNNPQIPILVREKYGNAIPDQYTTDNSITSIETLDLYLAKKKRGLTNPVDPKIIDSIPGEDHMAFIERVATRFDKTAVGLSDMLRAGVKRFPDSKIIVEPKGVPFTPDAGLIGQIDTINCVVATMAFQYNTSDTHGFLRDDFYLHVDSRLYFHKKHSALSQNVLFLHEVVWSFERENEIRKCLQGEAEFREACFERITSRNSQILAGAMIREVPAVTLSRLLSEVANLGFVDQRIYRSIYPSDVYAPYSFPERQIEAARKIWKDKAISLLNVNLVGGDVAKSLLAEVSAQRVAWNSLDYEIRWGHDFIPTHCSYDILYCDYNSLLEIARAHVEKYRKHKQYHSLLGLYERLSVLVQRVAQAREQAIVNIRLGLDEVVELEVRHRVMSIPYMPEAKKAEHFSEFGEWKENLIKHLANDEDRKKLLADYGRWYRDHWSGVITHKPIFLDYPIP